MKATSWTLACVLLVVHPDSGFAGAPEPTPAAASAANVKRLTDRLRGVMHDVTSLTYDGESRSRLPDGKRIAVAKTKVTAERIEGGAWKLLVDGTFGFEVADAKKADAPPIGIRAAYDGTVVSTVIEKRKQVRKSATQDFNSVRLEMNQGDAASTVCWELLSNPPFGNIDRAEKVEVEEPEKAGDQPCDVLWVVPARVGQNPPVPYRVFLATSDGLPRKIEHYRPAVAKGPKDKRGEPTIVMSIADIVGIPEPASDVKFEVETPKGFAVSGDRDLKKPAETPKPAPAQPTPPPEPAAATGGYKFPLLPSSDDLIRVGTAAPEFKLKDFGGKEHSLSEFKGKVVVLDFWGTWCPPCRMAMPAVQAVHEKYKDKGVVVIGMNYESNPKADPEKFKKDKGYTYMSLAKGDTVQGPYKVDAWPTFYVIGKDGKVVWASAGVASPPTGSVGNDSQASVDYLQSNLSQAVDKALQ